VGGQVNLDLLSRERTDRQALTPHIATMSIYLYEPTEKLLSASEEFKSKGIAGRRSTPSATMITVARHQFQPELAESFATIWMALAYTSHRTEITYCNDNFFKPMNLHPSPFALPRLQFATNQLLQTETLEKYKLKKLPTVRVSKDIKGLYSAQTNMSSLLELAQIKEVIKNYSAPPGYGSINELRAFEMLRRIIQAMAGSTCN
jgi:hypothetical protein